MIKNEYVLVVDVKKKHTAIVPTFVQHDSATLIFKVYDNGAPFDLTDVTSVQVSHQRKDGAVVIGTATYQSVNGESIIKYEYMGNEMSKEGFVETSVTIFSGVDKVTIQPFKVSIVGDFRNALGATEEFGLLQDLIVKTEKTIEDAKTATNKANLSSFNADVATSEANMARDGANAAATNANQKAEYVIANETVREIAETDRKTEESNRKLAESQRVIEEGVRATAEGLRNSSESTRSANEDARILAETDRKDSEIARTTKENNRDLAESTRKTNETARKTSEINRDTAESARTSSETQRDSAEKAREVSETNRRSAETGRISAEDVRALAESRRQTDESLRVLAETKRQTDTASALEAVNTASTSAQAIIDNSEFQGEFSLDTQYKKNNTVSFNGSSYIAKQDTLGNSPSQPNSLYWGMIAQRGIDGTGSVSSVNGTFPDESGNVTLSVPEGHTHANKVVLDKLSDTAGTLQYNGLDVGSVVSVNGQKGEVTGLETIAGSQEKATLAEGNAKTYTDQKVVDLTVFEAKEEFVATEGQTIFNLAGEYEVGKNRISAIVGGVPQYESFTETNNKTITFSEPIPTGVDVVFIYFKALPVGDGLVTSVNNTIPDVNGNVTLNIPEPDLSGYATKTEVNDLAGTGNTKTVKQLDDALATHSADYASLKGDLSTLKTTAKDSIPNIVNELFTNVSNGKRQVGTAITGVDSKVIVPTDPTFAELANAVGKISTGVKISPSLAGDLTIIESLTLVSSKSLEYAKVKEIQVSFEGTVRVSFKLISQTTTVYGRIYKNGVGVGTERYVQINEVIHTEDISVSEGDLIQIYTKTLNSSYPSMVSDFKLSLSRNAHGTVVI